MDLGTAMGAGWSSGISVYGVVALVGLAGRFDWIDAPSFVEQWWVIGGAVVLFLAEFVIDKIALLDSVWDGIHTFVRPAVGGYLMSTADSDLSVPALAVSGVLLALASHSAKASTRLVVNTSPEPASNVAVSLGEDGMVVAVMALAIANPEIAAVVVVLLTLASVVVAVVLYRVARRVARRLGSSVRGSTVRGGSR
jgi:hypothetical protein